MDEGDEIELLAIGWGSTGDVFRDVMFEISDLPAERWLGSMELLFGSNSQAACVSYGDEVAEMPELHHNLPCLASMGPAYKVFSRPNSGLYRKKHCMRSLPAEQSASRP
jgi:hypothetical protein